MSLSKKDQTNILLQPFSFGLVSYNGNLLGAEIKTQIELSKMTAINLDSGNITNNTFSIGKQESLIPKEVQKAVEYNKLVQVLTEFADKLVSMDKGAMKTEFDLQLFSSEMRNITAKLYYLVCF